MTTVSVDLEGDVEARRPAPVVMRLALRNVNFFVISFATIGAGVDVRKTIPVRNPGKNVPLIIIYFIEGAADKTLWF
jgi:hypothetical protein